MLDRLPVLIDPLKFSEKGKVVTGSVVISELDRLADILLDDSGEIKVELAFGKEGRLAYVEGKIKANLLIKCQACLGSIDQNVNIDFKLALVSSMQQVDRLSNEFEPLILEDEKVLLNNLIEDELLLKLPDFPRHEFDCIKVDQALREPTDQGIMDSKADNPFSILKKLKNTGDK